MSGTGVNNRPPLQSDETQIKRRSLKMQPSDASQKLSHIELYYLTIYSTVSLTAIPKNAKYPSILTNPTNQNIAHYIRTVAVVFFDRFSTNVPLFCNDQVLFFS